MNARRFTRHLAAGRAAAETHLAALKRGYRTVLRQAGRDAAAAFSSRATALTADATNPKWVPPEDGELIDESKLAADAKHRTAGAHQRALRAVMKPTLDDARISFDVTNPVIARQFEKLGVRAQDLGDAVRLQISNAIRDAYQQGLSIPDTAAAIVNAVDGISDTRATLLARTDMIGLTNGGSLAAAQLVEMPFKQWLTAQDERVRDSHADADGQTVPIDQPFDVGGASLDYPGDPDGPDEEVFNCFPGGTLVAGTVRGAFRSFYRGSLITISTRGGRQLSGTPNHPVLTTTGWKPLGELHEGDHLVCAPFEKGSVAGTPDVEHAPARIEQVFDALAPLLLGPRVRRSDVNFHGDVPDGDVDVVRADSLLELPCTPTGFKPSEKLALPIADELERPLATGRLAFEFGDRGRATSTGVLRPLRKLLPFGRSHFARAQEHRGRLVATLDTSLIESSLDHGATDPHSRRDGLFGQSLVAVEPHDLGAIDIDTKDAIGHVAAAQVVSDRLSAHAQVGSDSRVGVTSGVSTDDVLSVDSALFHGDVFTLDTEQGYYIANGICVRNCRCTLVYTDSADATVASAGNQPDPALASGGLMDTSPAVTAAVTITLDDQQTDGAFAADGAAWEAVLCVEGEPTEDGRLLEIGSTEWRDLPITLMALFSTGAGGHEGALISGRIDRIWRDETDQRIIRGAGVFDVGDAGREAERLVRSRTLRGVSIDPVVTEWEYRDRETGQVLEGDDFIQAVMDDRPLLFVYLRHTIVEATVCPGQAIADADIVIASGALHASWYTEWQPSAPLTAAASAPVAPLNPPREWFETQEPPGLMPLTVLDDGRVFGHIADWSTCHTGVAGVCTTAPASPSGYAYFHVGELETAEGDRLAVGKIMLGGKHAPLSASRLAASEHYDDNTTVGAYVRAVDGEHGIWVCGTVRHDLDAGRVAELRANPPSGDWRAVNHRLELIAALAVPVPGFPVPRAQAELLASAGEIEIPSLLLSSGEMEPTREVLAALVAAGVADEALLDRPLTDTEAGARVRALAARAEGGIEGLAALAEA